MLHSLPVQILTNFLAYFSNSNYKDSTIYVVKYMKYLEQSISQATRFCGGLGHWSTNIFPFLFCLWTLAMGWTLTNRLIEKRGREAWNVLVWLGLPCSTSVFTTRREWRACPRKPTGPRRMRNNKEDLNQMHAQELITALDHLQLNHSHKSKKSNLDLHATSFRVVCDVALLWL